MHALQPMQRASSIDMIPSFGLLAMAPVGHAAMHHASSHWKQGMNTNSILGDASDKFRPPPEQSCTGLPPRGHPSQSCNGAHRPGILCSGCDLDKCSSHSCFNPYLTKPVRKTFSTFTKQSVIGQFPPTATVSWPFIKVLSLIPFLYAPCLERDFSSVPVKGKTRLQDECNRSRMLLRSGPFRHWKPLPGPPVSISSFSASSVLIQSVFSDCAPRSGTGYFNDVPWV